MLRIHAILLFSACIVASLVLSISSEPLLVVVHDDAAPIANADVGWQGNHQRAVTDSHGRCRLAKLPNAKRIIATKPGYRIASTLRFDQPNALRLQHLPALDNDDYAWIDPHPDAASPINCGNCHTDIYREWLGSAHANSTRNPKFLALFDGSDGEHQTWNARVEHPDGSAVCAKCHAPTLDSATLEYDVRTAVGINKSGIHCDYCHKVADAPLGKLGTRFGRDGLELLRPAVGDLLTFGPLDDAVRAGESFAFAPVYKESRYCAACHEGIVFGVHAYGTYSEWLDSPAKRQGKQCQDCHMTPSGTMTNIAPGKGGIERDPNSLASHHTPGGTLAMLRQALKLDVCTGPDGRLNVTVTAQRVGHRVPTGFVDRHLMLVVAAFNADGQRVNLLDGPRLPANTGKWQGQPGTLYAKQLIGDKQRTPSPFWLPVQKIVDTRLLPETPNRRSFVFAADARRVNVQLWYRRFWQEVADARGWEDNDLLVADIDSAW